MRNGNKSSIHSRKVSSVGVLKSVREPILRRFSPYQYKNNGLTDQYPNQSCFTISRNGYTNQMKNYATFFLLRNTTDKLGRQGW